MKYFQPSEFKCPDGTDLCMSQDFLGFLDLSRSIAGVSFKLNSAYRSPEYNAEVGGKPTSAHIKGMAVDIAAETPRDRYRILVSLIVAGIVRQGALRDGTDADEVMEGLMQDISRFGIGDTFIHVDCDATKDPEVIWLY